MMAKNRKVKRKPNKKPGQLKQRLYTSGLLAWKGIRRIWIPALVIVSLLLIRHWTLTTPQFGLVWVQDNINACKNVDRESLFKFIDIRRGTNLFTIDLAKLQNQIMTHHWVKGVRITRQLPDTLIIKIEEHKPFALIDLGVKYYVNEEGILFAKVGKDHHDENGDKIKYPVVLGFSTTDFKKGQKTTPEKKECLRKVVSLIPLAQYYGNLSKDRIREVLFDPKEGYGIVLEPKGMVVKLGNGDFIKKLSRFKLIYNELGGQANEVTMVDLENPERAVIRGLRKVDAG